MNSLARLYQDQAQFEKADPLFTKVLQARIRILGAEHNDTLDTLGKLARLHLSQGRYSQAEPLLRQLLNSQQKKSPDGWHQYETQSLLGASIAGQLRFTEAEPLLEAGYEGLLQRQSGTPAVEQAGERIVQLYISWGKSEKAAQWRERLSGTTAAGLRH